MTTQQAIQILENSTANIPATRQQHQAITQALMTVKQACALAEQSLKTPKLEDVSKKAKRPEPLPPSGPGRA